MANKFLDATGVGLLWARIKTLFNTHDEAIEDLNTTVEQHSSKIDALESGTYDDTELRGLISTNAQAIETLNGDADTVGSVANTANAAAAAKVAEIVANADADFDTLKEIADWILNDTTGAADMANDIAELQEKLEGIDTTVVERITTEISNALTTGGANKYALAADLTALATRVKTLEDNAPTALTEQEIDDAIASVETN